MTCREFADFIMDYLAGELPELTRSAFDRHLRVCRNCQRYLAGYEETMKLGKVAFAADDSPLPADVPDDLVVGILNAIRGS